MIELHPVRASLELSGIRKYTNLAQSIPGCISLALGEPCFDTPQPIKDAAAKALAEGQTHYTANQGLPELRQAIARWETERGLSCDDSQVIVTVGASGALFNALMAILKEGEEVVIPTPAFPLYLSNIAIAGGVSVCMDTSKDGFQITKEALDRVITEKTKAILLNSPNNPTGVVLTRESLENVKAAVKGKDIFVICDNVYQQLADGDVPDLTLDPEIRDQVILCQSFSKPYAMTGWRIGYLVTSRELAARIMPLNAAQIASIPTFLQAGSVEALSTDVSDMMDFYAENRRYVISRLTEMGLTFPKPEGAFYIFPDIRKFDMTDDEFCTRLAVEEKLAAVPGSCFGTPGYMRLSYCCSQEHLKEGLDRLAAFIKKLEA